MTARSAWLNRNVVAMGATSLLSDASHEAATAVLPGFLLALVPGLLSAATFAAFVRDPGRGAGLVWTIASPFAAFVAAAVLMLLGSAFVFAIPPEAPRA